LSPLSGDDFVIVSQEGKFLKLMHAYKNVLSVP
jgi:hypothetical protein